MSGRRKDMWRLLYNLVNRDETEPNDVLAFVDDILCKEPRLIRHSLKANTNKFQDSFILWLVNKLLRSLNMMEDDENDIFEKNLKVQRKLLNSCLVNRVVLFEKLLKAYINAIDQLCEEYGKMDDSVDQEEVFLKVTAFSCSDHEVLKEIDADFCFPVIEVNSDDLDDYVQALLQVLHHGLFVGYINYPEMFQSSLLVVFKALKLCDFSTKLYCLQYVGRVFEGCFTLSDELHCRYELTLRSLTTMWNYCPIWLTNHCLVQDNIDDFIEESSSVLKILSKFISQIPDRTIIERHCLQLFENLYEIQRWQSFQAEFDLSRLKELAATLADFMFGLFMENLRSPQKIESKYAKILLKFVDVFPMTLRAMAPHLARSNNQDELCELLKQLEKTLTKILRNSERELTKN